MSPERSLSFLSGSLVSLFLILSLQYTCIAKQQEGCVPSSCGKISNISYPFRLKHDPPNCGNPSYELACENSITVLYLYPGKYYVESINYNNFTIRLVDPGVHQTDCNSIPRYFFQYDLSSKHIVRSDSVYVLGAKLFQYVIFLNCSNPVRDGDYPEYVDTASCISWNSSGHIYAIAGDLMAQRLKVDCRVMKVAATSLWGPEHLYNRTKTQRLSYTDVHTALAFGFETSWVEAVCGDYCGRNDCYYGSTTGTFKCLRTG